jgi:exopolysaccharide biosynthesis polyprenyl glycosylphosphotransferase
VTIPLRERAISRSGIGAKQSGQLLEHDFRTIIERLRPDARKGREGKRSMLLALIIGDMLGVSVALMGGQLIDLALNGRGSTAAALESACYAPVFLTIMGAYGLYRRGRRRLLGSSFPDFGQLVHSLILSSLATLFVAGGLHRWLGLPNVDRTVSVFSGLLALLIVPQARALARWTTMWRSSTSQSKVLVVGSGVVASGVVARLSRVDEVSLVGWVDDNMQDSEESGNELPLGAPRLGGLEDIPSVVSAFDVDHVVVAFSPATGATLASLLRAMPSDVRISIVPRLFDLLSIRSNVDDLLGLPIIDVAPASLGPADRFAKRTLDILVSGLGLVLLFPVLVAITTAIKATSPGPILFSQQRIGRGGKTFRIHKFRTMRVGAEEEKAALDSDLAGPMFKIHKDPRVTAVGRFLRQTSLDELPQLINVLIGEMSLVGPRPFIPLESAEIARWAVKRFDVRPGMTGLWQVSGRNDLPFEELCRLDYSYAASWSLWWDLRILWQTPGRVFQRHGAY